MENKDLSQAGSDEGFIVSEVQRYKVAYASDMNESEHGDWVHASDYDEAQDELAALREELASANADKEAYGQNAIDLQTRLYAAEQRNAELVELLRELDENWNSHDGRERFSLAMRKVEAAIKPTESGASE